MSCRRPACPSGRAAPTGRAAPVGRLARVPDVGVARPVAAGVIRRVGVRAAVRLRARQDVVRFGMSPTPLTRSFFSVSENCLPSALPIRACSIVSP